MYCCSIRWRRRRRGGVSTTVGIACASHLYTTVLLQQCLIRRVLLCRFPLPRLASYGTCSYALGCIMGQGITVHYHSTTTVRIRVCAQYDAAVTAVSQYISAHTLLVSVEHLALCHILTAESTTTLRAHEPDFGKLLAAVTKLIPHYSCSSK